LREDLKRRDLTINAIAQDKYGNIIDPYNGMLDLKKKILKNISLSFIEDPLRVLRAARFLSKFYYLGFRIHFNLFKLMKIIVKKKEIEQLSFDRISKEIKKALICKNPEIFFKVLYYINALKVVLPTLYNIWNISDKYKYIHRYITFI